MKSYYWTLAAVGLAFGTEAADEGSLPLREIIMYTSGTALFERAGEIDGNATVELRFKTEDINDLLKSMVVQGADVATVTYDSRDPITKTLRSFGVDLTENPGMRQLLNQMRGEQVQLFWPNKVNGTILGVEEREERVSTGNDHKTVKVDYLNLLDPDGLVSVPLAQIQKIQLENKRLDAELRQALQVLAGAHDTQKKVVSIAFAEGGAREVRVSYIAEAPVWKTSYRLVLGDKNPFLQGWAIVENTTDEDWQNVQLSLVSGRPISFIMDLYEPLYAPRPRVEPELYLSLRPHKYESEIELLEQRAEIAPAAAPPAAKAMAAGMADSAVRLSREVNLSYYKQAAERKREDIKLGVVSAQGQMLGELFEYAIRTPVTVPRQKSAMLPIVGDDVAGRKLSIYNQSVQAKHPLNGFRLTNSTSLHLMQGPITVFDGGSYAGDAQIDDLPAGQDRLISYALDLKVEVEPQSKPSSWELIKVRVKQGTFYATKEFVEEQSYKIRNRDSKSKEVLIEHPYRSDWELESPKAAERARDVYRFSRVVEAGQGADLLVREKKTITEEAYITTLHAESYGFYLKSPKVSNAVKELIRKVQAAQQKIADVKAQRERHEQRVKEIGVEQARIRENMSRLQQNSELFNRYVKKFDDQETEVENLRTRIEQLKEEEAALHRKLNDELSRVELD